MYTHYLFIAYLFLAALGHRCWIRAFSSCGERGLLAGCGAQAFPCSCFFCCRAWALGARVLGLAAGELSSCGLLALGLAGVSSCSTGVIYCGSPSLEPGLSCGIFLDQGLSACPLYWQADSYPLCHQGSPCFWVFCLY